jgi:adenine-specific DNA-methyltransferase
LFKTRAKIFQSPKSPQLVAQLLQTCTSGTDLVLDFFAGAGTTAEAVYEQNHTDGADRRFILVQLPEPTPERSEARKAGYATVADVCEERVRRVLSQLGEGSVEKHGEDKSRGQPGFRVYKLAESNFTTWEGNSLKNADLLQKRLLEHVRHIREDRTEEDILAEILLKSGFQLTEPVETVMVSGTKAYNVGRGALLVCLERQLTLEAIRSLADRRPESVVCLDEGFAGNDQLKVNAVQSFKTKGASSFRTV